MSILHINYLASTGRGTLKTPSPLPILAISAILPDFTSKKLKDAKLVLNNKLSLFYLVPTSNNTKCKFNRL